MRLWGSALGLLLGIMWFGSGPVAAADPRPSEPKPPEVARRLAAVEEAQRSLAVDIGALRDHLRQIEERIGEVREQVKQGQDAAQANRDQLKEMREEIRGLYVESNSLKGEISQLRNDIQGVDASFGNFRFNSGVLVAVLIVLQVIVVALALRGRG